MNRCATNRRQNEQRLELLLRNIVSHIWSPDFISVLIQYYWRRTICIVLNSKRYRYFGPSWLVTFWTIWTVWSFPCTCSVPCPPVSPTAVRKFWIQSVSLQTDSSDLTISLLVSTIRVWADSSNACWYLMTAFKFPIRLSLFAEHLIANVVVIGLVWDAKV